MRIDVLRHVPRRLHPVGRLVGAQADAGEHGIQIQSRLAHHLGDRGRVGAIGTRAILGRHAGRGGKRDQQAGHGCDRAETGRKAPTLYLERQRPRRVEDHDFRGRRQVSQRAQQVEQPHRVDRNIAVAVEPRIGRDQVIVTFELQAITGEIDNRDRVRTGRFDLGDEIAEQAAQVGLIDVRALDNLEADAGQRFGDEPAVGERGLEWTLGIGGIADDQRDALLGLCRQREQEEHRRGRGDARNDPAQHVCSRE